MEAKHKPVIIVLVILFFICIISFSVVSIRTNQKKSHDLTIINSKSFDDLLGTKDSNISKIFMRNGNNGDSVSTTDKTKIKELITLVNNRYYSKSSDQRDRTGYDYFYTFYVEDKAILTITGSGKKISTNNGHYDVSNEIQNTKLTDWFNSLPLQISE